MQLHGFKLTKIFLISSKTVKLDYLIEIILLISVIFWISVGAKLGQTSKLNGELTAQPESNHQHLLVFTLLSLITNLHTQYWETL